MATPQPSAQARRYLDYLRASGPSHRDELELPIAARRLRFAAECAWGAGDPEPVSSVADVDAAGVPAKLYRPLGNETDVFVWFHGGGWMVGSPAVHDALSRFVAARAKCAVLSVDYRLAPEHIYPAAIDDAWVATKWAHQNFRQVAIGGDSSGGNLAAAVAIRARDAEMEVRLQVLVYPVLADLTREPSGDAYAVNYAGFAGDPDFGPGLREAVIEIWDSYVPDTARREEPDASPLRAASLRRVAPTYMLIAEHDLLRTENEAYVDRLQSDGVPVEVDFVAGQVHGFVPLIGQLDDARTHVERYATALRNSFGRA